MRTLLSISILAVAAAAFVVPVATPSAAASADTLYVAKSQYGPILFAGNGRALYAFTKDSKNRRKCSGECLKAWPPFLVKLAPKAGKGAKRSLLGTIRASGGKRQVTYKGQPLYYYIGEKRPGQVLCQGVNEFGGLWLVVRSTGKLVH
jgi:predicted lipoprotein with Yx(FWY)xxD motif